MGFSNCLIPLPTPLLHPPLGTHLLAQCKRRIAKTVLPPSSANQTTISTPNLRLYLLRLSQLPDMWSNRPYHPPPSKCHVDGRHTFVPTIIHRIFSDVIATSSQFAILDRVEDEVQATRHIAHTFHRGDTASAAAAKSPRAVRTGEAPFLLRAGTGASSSSLKSPNGNDVTSEPLRGSGGSLVCRSTVASEDETYAAGSIRPKDRSMGTGGADTLTAPGGGGVPGAVLMNAGRSAGPRRTGEGAPRGIAPPSGAIPMGTP